MPGLTMKLTRWQAALALVILAGIIAVRLLTLSDKTNDTELMRLLKQQLSSGTAPELKIEMVQASLPLLDFSTSKSVVVKVETS